MLKPPATSSSVAEGARATEKLPDWNDFHVLMTVVRLGSLNRAAEALNLTQPTVSRRIASLEQVLGVRVLSRSTAGSELTLEGRRIVERLVAAQEALDSALNGETQREKDVVTLHVTDGLTAYWITHFLPALYTRHPKLELRFLATNQSAPRSHHDLSLQFLAPSDPDAVALRLGMLHFLPYASQSYIERHGRPGSLEDFANHRLLDFLLYVADEGSWSTKLPHAIGRARTQLFTNSSAVLAEAVRNGCGIALLPTYGSVFERDFVPLDVALRSETPFWLCYRPHASAKPCVALAIRFLRHVFDSTAMPWFGDDYVAPNAFPPFSAETWMTDFP